MMMIITMTTLMMLMNRDEAVNHPNPKIILGRPNPQTIVQRGEFGLEYVPRATVCQPKKSATEPTS